MTRLDQLRQRFSAGMAQGTISAEDWEEEFLPMIRNSERYQAIRDNPGDWRLMVFNGRWIELTGNPGNIDTNADIDVRTKEIDAIQQQKETL